MRRTIAAAAIAGLIGGYAIAGFDNTVEIEHRVQVIERQTEPDVYVVDLDAHRDVSAVSEHDDAIMAECAYAIQHRTDEPLAGIVLYVERYWSGDACAAFDHLVDHGWY